MINSGLTSPASTAAVPRISALTSPKEDPIRPGMRVPASLMRSNTVSMSTASPKRLMDTMERLWMMLVRSDMGSASGWKITMLTTAGNSSASTAPTARTTRMKVPYIQRI